MTSTIPYDPDEFDNNPFAEPSGSVLGGSAISSAATATTPKTPPNEGIVEEHAAEPDSEVNDGSHDDGESHTAGSKDTVEEEDAKPTESAPGAKTLTLIPERCEDPSLYTITVKVTSLERSGSLVNKKENPAVIFDLSTNITHFRKKLYKGVKKSYAEFHLFWKFLNGANPECFVPAIPLAYTNFGILNEEDYKRTLHSFQVWFSRITGNPILVRNEEFVFFVESDFGTYSPIHKSELPATGLKRKTLKQFQPPYDEVLELAEFRPLVKSTYQNAKSSIEKLEKLSKLRRQLGQHENELGAMIAELCVLETTHPGMQNMWKKFGKTLTTVGDLDSVMGSYELATLGDGLQGIINDGYIIKEALTNRHLLMRDLINAQATTKVKHESARKLRNKRDINPIKVDEAIRSLEEATGYEDELSKKIKRITEEMLIEKKEYMAQLDEQIKAIMRDFVVKRIDHERRKLRVLEKVRIDVRLVDENGGLARLGRESYPLTTKNVLTSSQTLDGDSWSGDRKVSHVSRDLLNNDDDNDAMEHDDAQHDSAQAQAPDDAVDETPLDARNAASLLGGSTF